MYMYTYNYYFKVNPLYVASVFRIHPIYSFLMWMWKVNDNDNYEEGQRTNFDQKSSHALKAQVC